MRTAWVLLAIGIAVHAMVVQTIDAELQRQLRFHAEFVATYLVAPAADDSSLTEATIATIVSDDPQVTSMTVRDAAGAVLGRAGEPAPTDVRHVVDVPGTDLRATVAQDDEIVQAAATATTRRLTLVLGAGLAALWLAVVPLAYRLGRELRGQADELRAQSDELRAQSDELRTQSDELREQSIQLQRLLDREQMTVQRLQEADELRDRFLESVSHELRTPMTVVKGSLALLRQHGDALPPEARRELLDRANTKAARLDELVLGLLEMNRSLEAATDGRLVSVPDVVRDVRTQLPPRDVELDLQVTAITTSPTRLTRALANLVGNAIRHAPDDDLVVVRTRVTGTAVELQVDDRGPGIPDDLKHAVFDPFRQGELHDAHAPGIGMGLSIVARYAAEHHGRAWVTDRPGGGTRVHVLLEGVLPEGGERDGPTRTLLGGTPPRRVVRRVVREPRSG